VTAFDVLALVTVTLAANALLWLWRAPAGNHATVRVPDRAHYRAHVDAARIHARWTAVHMAYAVLVLDASLVDLFASHRPQYEYWFLTPKRTPARETIHITIADGAAELVKERAERARWN